MSFNRTDLSLLKQVNKEVWKKNCPNFFFTDCIKLEECQSNHFPIHS